MVGAMCVAVALAACGEVVTQPRDPNDPDPDPSGPVTALVEVDVGTDLQPIAGFGSNTIPLVWGGVDYLGSLRPAALDAAYSEVGLSLGLLNIGVIETVNGASDTWSARGNDNDDPLVIDPAGFDFTASDELWDAIVRPARDRGHFDLTIGHLLGVWSSLDWMEDIRSNDYSLYLAEAAEHVLAVVQGWESRYGEAPSRIQLFNEPTTGNRELSSSSAQEVHDLVLAIGERLEGAGYGDIRFLVPNEETIARTLLVSRILLEDPATRRFVGAIGYHNYPYGTVYASNRLILETSGNGRPDPGRTSEMRELADLGASYGVPIWLTEASEGPALNDYPFGSFENVLATAIHIHDNFTYANASAFYGMQTLWDSRTHAEHFAGRNVPFLTEVGTVVLTDLDSGQSMITGAGYAIGHHARWLDEGAFRLAATSDDARVLVSAFRDAPRQTVTVVVINATFEDQVVRIDLEGAAPNGTIRGETSFGGQRWGATTGTTTSGSAVTQAVQPRSVTTLSIPIG